MATDADMPGDAEVLSISSRREGPLAVVQLGGELDLHGSDRLTAEVQRVLRDTGQPLERLEIDARELTFADSAGLRAVLRARAEAQTTGVVLQVTAVSAQVERVIHMAGLSEELLAGS